VFHDDSALRQGTPNQKTAMTIEWVVLGAHQGDAAFQSAFQDSIQPALEFFGISHSLIIGHTLAVKSTVARATT
jgi:hypothetical protein